MARLSASNDRGLPKIGLGLGLGLGLGFNRSESLWPRTRSPNGLGGGAVPRQRHFQAVPMSGFEILESRSATQVERVLAYAAITGSWSLTARDMGEAMLDGDALA